jgi:hypothetical protein
MIRNLWMVLGAVMWRDAPSRGWSEVARNLIRTGVGALFREGTPMLKVVHDEAESNATGAVVAGSSLLDEIVRDGARQILAAALLA